VRCRPSPPPSFFSCEWNVADHSPVPKISFLNLETFEGEPPISLLTLRIAHSLPLCPPCPNYIAHAFPPCSKLSIRKTGQSHTPFFFLFTEFFILDVKRRSVLLFRACNRRFLKVLRGFLLYDSLAIARAFVSWFSPSSIFSPPR